MTLQHNLCSLHGLCPSISEYLTTPEKTKHTNTTWGRCAGELKERRKGGKFFFQDSTNVKMHVLQNKVISLNRNIYIFLFLCWFPGGNRFTWRTCTCWHWCDHRKKTKWEQTTTDELHLYRSSLPSWEDDGVKIHC